MEGVCAQEWHNSDKGCGDRRSGLGDSAGMSRHHRKTLRAEADAHQKNGLAIAMAVVAVVLVVGLIAARVMVG